jgi:hypothetical protein
MTDDFFALETDEGLLFVNKQRVRDIRLFIVSPLPMDLQRNAP